MKATDLRIGNLLEYAGQPVYVLGIQQATEFMGDSHHLDLGYYTDSVGFERHENDQDLRPLPLTEEWLKRFGFEEYHNNPRLERFYVLKSGYYPFQLYVDRGCEIYFTPNVRLKTVHQLQNLYYALTSEELTLSPPQR